MCNLCVAISNYCSMVWKRKKKKKRKYILGRENTFLTARSSLWLGELLCFLWVPYFQAYRLSEWAPIHINWHLWWLCKGKTVSKTNLLLRCCGSSHERDPGNLLCKALPMHSGFWNASQPRPSLQKKPSWTHNLHDLSLLEITCRVFIKIILSTFFFCGNNLFLDSI